MSPAIDETVATPTETAPSPETSNGEANVNTAAPKKAQRKAAKKAGKAKPKAAKKPAKAAKTKKTSKAKASPKAAPEPYVDPKPRAGEDALKVGGTRLRAFRALKKFSMGLTAKQIKEKTGMLPVSGHLAVILGEEIERKRIRVEDDEEKGLVYFLTAAGKKAVEDGEVDGRKTGTRIGEEWTKARIKADK